MVEIIIIALLVMSIYTMYPILKDISFKLKKIEQSLKDDGKRHIASATLKLPQKTVERIYDYQFIMMILLMFIFIL